MNLNALNFVARLVSILSLREKVLVSLSILIRLSLVSLDLIGIYLIGTVVSFLSGSSAGENSWFQNTISSLDALGIPNGYAVVLAFAILFFVLKAVFSVALNNLTASYLARLELRKSSDAFKKQISEKIEKLEESSPQEKVFATTESVAAATTRAAFLISTIIGETALLLAISIYMLLTDYQLFLLVGSFFLMVGLILNRFVTRTSGILRQRMHDSHLSSQGTLLETLSNYRQVVLSSNRNTLITKFAEDRRVFSKASAQFEIVTGLTRYIVEIAIMVGVGLLVLQRSLGDTQSTSASVIATFLAGIFRIVSSMVPLQSSLTAWKIIEFQAIGALDLLESPLIDSGLVSDNPRARQKPATLQIVNLTYKHTTSVKPVLNDVNLFLSAGTFAALVGSSGSGKSTLADLILGLRTPTYGSVLVDGESTNRKVSYVPQTVRLFSGTLFENVSLNFSEMSPLQAKKVKKALIGAGLSHLLSKLPGGLGCKLGEGGIQLSGGEIQRVGIARALFEEPRLLVLDEPTSALDPKSQLDVSRTIESLRGRVTILMIAHRHETISKADAVYKLANGTLIRV